MAQNSNKPGSHGGGACGGALGGFRYRFQVYSSNKCVTADGQFYTFSGSPLDPTKVPFTANNSFYSPGAVFDYGGHSLSDLQVGACWTNAGNTSLIQRSSQ